MATGVTGAIGMALLKVLLREGAEVYVICRPESKRINRLYGLEGIHLIECELSQLKEIKKSEIGSIDVFYHLGWDGTFGNERNNMYLQNKNVEWTLDAVCLAERLDCRIFVGAGSQAEYGRAEGVLKADTPVFPENGYGIAKLCAGQMSRVLCRSKGIKHIWTRILSIYGPYDREDTMVMSAIRKLLRNEKVSFTKAEQMWDYLYSEDAGEVLYLLSEMGQDGNTYVIGSGTVKPLAEYIYKIRDAAAGNARLGIGEIPYADKQVMYLCADIKPLENEIGFAPKYSFEQGIKKTVAWVKEECRNEKN